MDILNLHLRKSGKQAGFLKFLRENEADGIQQDLYRAMFIEYLNAAINANRLQQDVWEQSLTALQRQILDSFLEDNHPQLLVANKFWNREICQGIGRAMQIGMGGEAGGQLGSSLVRSYMLTMTKNG